MKKAGLLVVTQTKIQRRLREYGLKQGEQSTVEQIQAFADTYKGREVKECAGLLGAMQERPNTRWRQVYISWRFGCLRRGQECYRRAKEAARNDPSAAVDVEVLVIIGGSYMASSILPALLMSAIAFLIPLAWIALFKVLLHSGIKN